MTNENFDFKAVFESFDEFLIVLNLDLEILFFQSSPNLYLPKDSIIQGHHLRDIPITPRDSFILGNLAQECIQRHNPFHYSLSLAGNPYRIQGRYFAYMGNHAAILRAEPNSNIESIILDSGPYVVFRSKFDENFLTSYVSPNVSQYFGYAASDFLLSKNKFKDIVHPDDLPRIEEEEKVFIRGKFRDYIRDYRIFTKKGTVLYVSDYSVVTYYQSFPTEKISYILDITEQKEKEIEIIEQRNELFKIKRLFEETNSIAKIGGWELDLTHKQIWWSTETRRIHEVPISFSPNAENTLQFFSVGNEKERIYNCFKQSIETGVSFDEEFQIITGDGNKKWVRAIGHPEFVNGLCVRLYGSFQDITEIMNLNLQRTQALSNLQSLLDATTHVTIIATDLNGTITHFNKGAETLLLYKTSEVVGKTSPIVFHKKEEIKSRSEILSKEYGKPIEGFETFVARAKEGNFDSQEWIYVKKDGTEFPVQLIVTASKNSEGMITGYLSIGVDISIRKSTEKALIEAREKAEAASKSKSDFLANMSHEIRTPLNGVIGFSDLLLRTELTTVQRQYLETVNVSATSLLDLINDILDFSKIESGKMELHLERINLHELLRQISEIVKFRAFEKGLEFILNISPSVPRNILTDAIRLKQIILNLVGNSVKFTQQGEIQIQITAKNISSHEYEFLFEVIDTGIGISETNQIKIFEAFSQEDTSTTRQYGGTGLGLTISNKLLNLFDSKLGLKSTQGIGSCFYFNIRTIADNELYIEPEIDFIKNSLVLDDNLTNLAIIKEMLSHKKIKSILFSNPEDALNHLKTNPNYDLIITDYHMPNMDGLEFIQKANEIFDQNTKDNTHKNPYICLHTSSFNETIVNQAKSLSIGSVLLKPIQTNQLYESLAGLKNKKGNIFPNSLSYKHSIVVNKGLKVLIVEDNPVNMKLTKALVQKSAPGSVIIEANNGLEGVHMFFEAKPDIVFMDIQMPEMNGYDATKTIREKELGKKTPIIALTAGTVAGEEERCLAAGMNDYVSKPVTLNTLSNKIKSWIKED
ncbi:response regulator [Leptospira sp. 96542]|nr:response regulator [Leptospira sp. 96542]